MSPSGPSLTNRAMSPKSAIEAEAYTGRYDLMDFDGVDAPSRRHQVCHAGDVA